MSSVFHRARDTAMCWSKMKNYLHSVYLFVHVEKEYVRIRRIWHRKKIRIMTLHIGTVEEFYDT